MTRLFTSLLTGLLLLAPLAAYAHDPLDDVSGEEDSNNTHYDEERPKSHRVQVQEIELKRETEELEAEQFHNQQEKEEFLRDRTELRDIKDAQHHRDLLHNRRPSAGK